MNDRRRRESHGHRRSAQPRLCLGEPARGAARSKLYLVSGSTGHGECHLVGNGSEIPAEGRTIVAPGDDPNGQRRKVVDLPARGPRHGACSMKSPIP